MSRSAQTISGWYLCSSAGESAKGHQNTTMVMSLVPRCPAKHCREQWWEGQMVSWIWNRKVKWRQKANGVSESTGTKNLNTIADFKLGFIMLWSLYLPPPPHLPKKLIRLYSFTFNFQKHDKQQLRTCNGAQCSLLKARIPQHTPMLISDCFKLLPTPKNKPVPMNYGSARATEEPSFRTPAPLSWRQLWQHTAEQQNEVRCMFLKAHRITAV